MCSAYKCALIAQGMSSWSRSKLHFCLNNAADNSYLQNASISSSRMTIDYNGSVGINNTNPLSMLHIGNCTVTNSAPVIVFGKNVNGSSYRNAYVGYTDAFFFVIGDYGNTNTSNTLTSHFAILYSAPSVCLVIQNSGYVQMQYGYGTSSDERIKQLL